jgi:hypothetical protein
VGSPVARPTTCKRAWAFPSGIRRYSVPKRTYERRSERWSERQCEGEVRSEMRGRERVGVRSWVRGEVGQVLNEELKDIVRV